MILDIVYVGECHKRPIIICYDLLIFVLMLILSTKNIGLSFQPEFAEPILNLTVPIGRDATFKCLVLHLGGYRVGWVKADTKAIQAIHDHVITHNPRVSVSHDDYTTWKLHIRNVQEEDRGHYMCQINTDPMKSQVGYLDVVTPPDFVEEETSGDIMLPEGGSATLTCRAQGYPTPSVTWRREDGEDMILKETNGVKNKVTAFEGETLRLSKVTRSEMGAYLCIASNGVPPSISKRILVSVHFPPVIQVPNQLVGAPLSTDVKLECIIEASPKSINYWLRDTGEMIVPSAKYEIQTNIKSLFEAKMTVIIKNFEPNDIGSYHCVAKNSLGEMESTIRLYEIPGPTKPIFPARFDEEDYNEQFGVGSADRDIVEDDLINRVTERDKIIKTNLQSNWDTNLLSVLSSSLLPPTISSGAFVPSVSNSGVDKQHTNNKIGGSGGSSSLSSSIQHSHNNNRHNTNAMPPVITTSDTTATIERISPSISCSTIHMNKINCLRLVYFIILLSIFCLYF